MKINKTNKYIFISTLIFIFIFLAMSGYLIYFNVVKAEGIINNPYNKRQNVLSEKIIRGSILANDKTPIAVTNIDVNGKETRYYPYANLFSHIAGYLNNGGYGLERLNCYYMLQSNQNFFEQIGNDLTGRKNYGDNIVTTLDINLQKIAYDALGNNRGAVIISEPSTGKILAMVSKPDFDPNTLADNWSNIIAPGSDSVLVNRATQGLYPPGSTFKLVTMLEYIRENKATYNSYQYQCNGSYILGNTEINCLHSTAHGSLNLFSSLGFSCNSSFINIGLKLNMDSYRKTAEELLFNKELPVDLEYNKSKFVLTHDSAKWDIAQTAFGQGQTLVTPLHLSLITNAIANNGVLMNPVIVDHIENCNGITIKKFKTSTYGTLLNSDESFLLQKGMEEVVSDSFSWLFTGSNYSIAAKSGSAQYGTQGYEHSLFVSYSPIEKPEISVTVVIEGGPQRTTSAAEIAKIIYDGYYSLKK